MTRDAIGVLGFGLMVAGFYGRYGWEVACIIGGGTLLAFTVMGALRK